MSAVHFAENSIETTGSTSNVIIETESTVVDESRVWSSSDGAESSYTSFSLNPNDAKLSQLRRTNEKKGGLSKLKTRYQNLQSYDEMLKYNAFMRMQEGLRKLLELHTPVELSSICGCLHLKVQEKSNTSIEQILKYAGETEEFDKDKILKVFSSMWEGALWEYLHSTGHPFHSMRPDPRNTILQLWENGGFLEGGMSNFTPHFIVRETKNRFEWVQSKDIQVKLDALLIAQENAKKAETKIIAEHDYTNILTYFNKMSELRRLESSLREFLISELEICRSRVDSSNDVTKFAREQLVEAELFSKSVAEILNKKLGYAEYISEQNFTEKIHLERDLQRIANMLNSFMSSDNPLTNTNKLKFGKIGESSLPIQILHNNIHSYRSYCENREKIMTDTINSNNTEINDLKATVKDLQEKLENCTNNYNNEKKRADLLNETVVSFARSMTKLKISKEDTASESWKSSLRFASRVVDLENQLKKVKPLLLAGMSHSNKTIFEICFTLFCVLDIKSDQEYEELLTKYKMKKEDKISKALIQYSELQKSRKLQKMSSSSKTIINPEEASVKSSKSNKTSNSKKSSKGGSSKGKSESKGDSSSKKSDSAKKESKSKSSKKK